MNSLIPHTPLQAFLLNLEIVGHEGQFDAITRAITENGGSLISEDQDPRATHKHELTLFKITGRGDTQEEMVRDWQQAARRSLKEEKPPFPEPRNHAEEIENARWEMTRGFQGDIETLEHLPPALGQST